MFTLAIVQTSETAVKINWLVIFIFIKGTVCMISSRSSIGKKYVKFDLQRNATFNSIRASYRAFVKTRKT